MRHAGAGSQGGVGGPGTARKSCAAPRILAKATVGRWATGKGLSRPNDPTNDSTLPGYMPTGHENAYKVVGRSNLDPCQPRTIPSNDTETLLRRLLSFFTLHYK